MTVSSILNKIKYTGNGIVRKFAIPFKFFQKSDIEVYLASEKIPETKLILNSHYTIEGEGEEEGGEVTLALPLETNQHLSIVRVVSMTQEVDYRENEIFPAETQERALDRLTMMVQQNAEKLTRTLTLGICTESTADTIIPRILNAEAVTIDNVVKTNKNASDMQMKLDEFSGKVSEKEALFQNYIDNIPANTALFDIVCSPRLDVPEGYVVCNGGEYFKAQFLGANNPYDMLVAGKATICTYEEYEAYLVSNGGNCGFFALDTVNQKFRVPSIGSAYVGATLDTDRICAYEKDSVGVHKHATIIASSSTAYLPAYSLSALPSGNKQWGVTGSENTTLAAMMTDNGMKISGNDSPTSLKTQPETILMRFFIRLYTGAIEASVLQASELISALENKVDVSGQNIPQSFKKQVISWMMPDIFYGKCVQVWGCSFQMPCDGYVAMHGYSSNVSDDIVLEVSLDNTNWGILVCHDGGAACIPVFIPEGTWVKATGGNSYQSIIYYKLKGNM